MFPEVAIVPGEADGPLPFTVEGEEGLVLVPGGGVHLCAQGLDELHGTLDGAKHINRSKPGARESGVEKMIQG